MPLPLPVRTGAALVLVALLGGCGDEEPVGVADLPTAATSSAPDTRRVTCEVTTPTGTVTLALDLPTGFRDRGPCTWRRPVGVRTQAPGGPSVVTVAAVGADPDRTAATAREMYDEQRPFAVEDDDFNGDDTVYDLVYEPDVPVLGTAPGDRVSWRCFCDGAPELVRVAQAAGIELRWTAVPELQEQTDAELEAVLASAGRAP